MPFPNGVRLLPIRRSRDEYRLKLKQFHVFFIVKFSYKYRLFPTKTHIQKLESTLESSRGLYNSALEHRICAWRKARVPITYKDQANTLAEIKESRPEFQEIYSQVLQDVLRRLDKNFKAFFKRGRGFPRFRVGTGIRVSPILKVVGPS